MLFCSPLLVKADTLSIATQNVYNFYDDKKSRKKEKVLSKKNYQQRLERLSQHIVLQLQSPQIIALQEIENFSTLNDLKTELLNNDQQCYQAVLLNGHKRVAINLGYLISCEFELKNLSQLFKNQTLTGSNKALFTRPPLYIKVCHNNTCVHLVNLHLRSMLGLNRKNKRDYVAKKRLQQAQSLARWIDQFQTQWPNEHLIVLGDFNALNMGDRHVDVLSIIKGKKTRFNETYSSDDLVTKDLFDLSLKIPRAERFSYIYRKKRQTLDYMLVSKQLVPSLTFLKYTDINYQVSDHAGLVAKFKFD